MNSDEMRKKWSQKGEEVIQGMAEWSEAHPKATFREIEEEVDKCLGELRVGMIADTAGSRAEDGAGICPQCGAKLRKKGKKKRKLHTQGGREIELEREYAVCPVCGQGIFPPG